MSQAGGSATINGILYQILGTLHHAAKIGIGSSFSAEDCAGALLIVEPPDGGGDLQIVGSQLRIVEQWKAKSNAGAWSVKSVVEEVLPDLFLAVDGNRLDQKVEYLFVTEGHEGRFAATNELIAKMAKMPVPADPLAALDDTVTKKFFAEKSCSERDFFREILAVVRGRKVVANESEDVSARNLWHLLGRFRFAPPLPFDDLKANVNDILAEIVEVRDNVDAARLQACAALMEMARKGPVYLTPSELLLRLGLRARPFRDGRAWKILQQIVAEDFGSKLAAIRYDVSEDVRPSIGKPTKQKPLLIGGESGVGKSWAIARCGVDALQTSSLAVMVNASGDPEKTLQSIADVIWVTGLEHEQRLSLESVAKRMAEKLPARTELLAVVLVDNLQSMSEARQLLSQPWEKWNMALAISMPEPLASALAKNRGDAVVHIHVKDFSQPQLKEYLDRRGRDWKTPPSDIRDTLRRPLLARLYCDLAPAPNWHPTTEYQLYSAYWDRLKDPEHPSDITILKRLAKSLLDDAVPYPWTSPLLLSAGLDESMRIRLERAGWLKRVEHDKAQVWHARLLNWAIAEAVADELTSNPTNAAELTKTVAGHWHPQRGWAGQRRFGYVPMDLLWILLNRVPGQQSGALITQVLQSLDRGPMWWTYAESLYGEMLPPLGARILEPVLRRMETSEPADSKPQLAWVVKCFTRLAALAPNEVAQLTARMLQSQMPEVKELGVRILAKVPQADKIEAVWELHVQNVQSLENERNGLNFAKYNQTMAALRACVALKPEWIEPKLARMTAGQRDVSELASLVATLADESGQKLWHKLKDQFFSLAPIKARHVLASAVAGFHDAAEASRMVSWLSDPEWTPGYAFQALCTIAPRVALEHLRAVALKDAWLTRDAWLAELFWRAPNETRAAFQAWMTESPEQLWEVARLLRAVPHEFDPVILELMLAGLQRELRRSDAELETDTRPLDQLVETLAAIWSAEAIGVFQKHRNSEMEHRLAALLAQWFEKYPQNIGSLLDHTIDVLLKFGGCGIAQVVNALLRKQDPGAWLAGMKWAAANPNDETKQLLRAIAASNETIERQGGRYPFFQSHALVVLAALRDDATVAQTVLRWGGICVIDDLADVCNELSPMSDDAIAPALEALKDPSQTANALTVLGLSRRKDLIPLIKSHVTEDGPAAVLHQALWALRSMKAETSEMVPLLAKVARRSEIGVRSHAIRLLMHIDTDGAAEVIEKELIASGQVEIPSCHWRVTPFLLSKSNRRKRVLEYLWPKIRVSGDPFQTMLAGGEDSFGAFAELNSPEIEAFLWEQAFPEHTGINFVGRAVTAIRGLASIDPHEAFRAAETLLADTDTDRELLPRLLMELNPKKAVPLLCQNAIREQKAMVRWKTGVALRTSKEMDLVRQTLKNMLRSPEAATQQAGAELCQWMEPGFLADELRQLALAARERVREAARRSLREQQKAIRATEVSARLREATDISTWCSAEGVIQLINPLLLSRASDVYALRCAVKELPAIVCQHINDGVRHRQKDVERKAEELDREFQQDS